MKIRHILASVLFASFAAVGLAAGLKEAPARRASATIDETDYNIVGGMNGWGSQEENIIHMVRDTEHEENAAYVLNVSLTLDVEFKIRKDYTWDNTLGFTDIAGGAASGFFVYGDSNNNIKCKLED